MNKKMILASGLQSGGTTLISSCFLKHPDVDGVLDMASDRIEVNLFRVSTPVTWVKMTSVAFTWQEVAEVYGLEGFDVFPLLVVRNPFDAWASLKDKWYGLNSTTAEDPPLILRFRRFLNDWQFFIEKKYPVIQFEAFIRNPKMVLKQACHSLPMNFHSAMLQSNTNLSEFAYVTESNASFIRTLQKGISNKVATKARSMDEAEYTWIKENMHDLLAFYDYKNFHHVAVTSTSQSLSPQPFDSRRYLGFGPQVAKRKVSNKLPTLLAMCSDAINAKRKIYIYGACELGEYLLHFLHDKKIPVTAFVDAYADVTKKFCDLDVYRFNPLSHDNSFFVVASFNNATTIKDMLAEHIIDTRIFIF